LCCKAFVRRPHFQGGAAFFVAVETRLLTRILTIPSS
jgi:hypothetical protein